MPYGARRGSTRTAGLYEMTNRSKSGVNHEEKYFDLYDLNVGNVSATGDVIPSLNLVPVGAGASERIGRKFTITEVNCTYTITNPQTSVVEPNTTDNLATNDEIVFYLIKDKQCNGTAATPGDVIAPNPAVVLPEHDGFLNLENRDRFVVLAKHRHCFTPNAIGWNPASVDPASPPVTLPVVTVHEWGTRCRIPIEMSPGSPVDITNVRSNNLFILVFSRQGRAQFSCNTRIRYTDM